MANGSHGQRARSVAICALLVGWLASAMAARQVVPVYGAVLGGPSVLLSYANAASPYTGIGRYEGRETCTAFFLASVPVSEDPRDAPAYALTSGHCPVLSGANDVLLDRAGVGRVVFNFFVDSQRWQVAVPVARTAYATMKGRDLAVLELAALYKDLVGRLIRPWPVATSPQVIAGDPIAIVSAPIWSNPAEAFLRLTTCRIDGMAPVVLEHTWHWFDAPFNRCQDMLPGSSGSPVLSVINRDVVGMVNTTTRGAQPSTECALDHPCEPVIGGARSRPDTNYVTSVAGITSCFDTRRRFSAQQPGCPLDPGIEVQATPPFIGSVNPILATQPLGPPQRTWNVTLSGSQRSYQYAILAPPFDDCRTSSAYSAVLSVTAAPTIDQLLPLTEGFTFLCVGGPAMRTGAGGSSRPHPTLVVARIDMTPPRLPAQVTIDEDDAAWRVTFETVGSEVSFHAFKVGRPRDTRCDSAAGYQLALVPSIGLPKANAPYLLCAIPYDAAQNPGRLFERVLS